MYACMTPVGFDTSDKFENHCFRALQDELKRLCDQEILETT